MACLLSKSYKILNIVVCMHLLVSGGGVLFVLVSFVLLFAIFVYHAGGINGALLT